MESMGDTAMLKRLCALAGLLGWSLTATCQSAGGPSGPSGAPPQPIIGEQLIVKFAAHTPAREATAAALAGGPESKTRLDALAARLSAESGIPLQVVRPTSGQELVIAIDADALASKLVANLKARADVQAVRLLEPGDRTRQRYWNPTVAVAFQPGSPQGQAMAQTSEPNAERLEAFAAEVGDDVGFPVSARAPQTVELIIDMSSVAMDLVERFKRRPDVEYAQRDVLLRPLRD
jgi:hypothetical protein